MSSTAILGPFHHPSLSAPQPFSAELPASLHRHDACNGFITPADKLRDMIRISHQLVPGCLCGRGPAKSTFRLRCHFPSDNPAVLTGAGSTAIPLEERETFDHRLRNADQVGLLQIVLIKQKHSDLFRLRVFFFKRGDFCVWAEARHLSVAPLARFTESVI